MKVENLYILLYCSVDLLVNTYPARKVKKHHPTTTKTCDNFIFFVLNLL